MPVQALRGRSPDVQPAMSPVLTVSGGMGVVPDTVTCRGFRSHTRKPTPMRPSASASRLGYRHPCTLPHLHQGTFRLITHLFRSPQPMRALHNCMAHASCHICCASCALIKGFCMARIIIMLLVVRNLSHANTMSIRPCLSPCKGNGRHAFLARACIHVYKARAQMRQPPTSSIWRTPLLTGTACSKPLGCWHCHAWTGDSRCHSMPRPH